MTTFRAYYAGSPAELARRLLALSPAGGADVVVVRCGPAGVLAARRAAPGGGVSQQQLDGLAEAAEAVMVGAGEGRVVDSKRGCLQQYKKVKLRNEKVHGRRGWGLGGRGACSLGGRGNKHGKLGRHAGFIRSAVAWTGNTRLGNTRTGSALQCATLMAYMT